MVQNGRVYSDHACVYEFFEFWNPYDVICTFSKAQHGTECRNVNGLGTPWREPVVALVGPKNT